MTTVMPEDTAARVRSYIQHQGSKEPAAIRALVQESHDKLMRILDGLSEEQAAFKPSPEEWSVLQVLDHVVAAKKGTARLCVALSKGERPGPTGGEGELRAQDGVTGRHYETLAEAREAVDAAHGELLAFLDGFPEDANTTARFPHFIFGEVNCKEWAAFQRVHDTDHTNQIEQVTSAAGFPKS